MSRVARKKLEKEAKRNKMSRLFLKNKKNTRINIDKSTENKKNGNPSMIDKMVEISQNDEDKDKKIFDNIVEKNLKNSGLADNKNSQQSTKNKRISNIEEVLSGNIGINNDIDKTIVNVQGMKTADKIISVEDERMYFERKKKGLTTSNIRPENVLTVGDITTAEDEGRYTEKNRNDIEEKNVNEDDINKKKRLCIEEAPFEDVVRVAESRKQAEKERLEKERLEKENASNQGINGLEANDIRSREGSIKNNVDKTNENNTTINEEGTSDVVRGDNVPSNVDKSEIQKINTISKESSKINIFKEGSKKNEVDESTIDGSATKDSSAKKDSKTTKDSSATKDSKTKKEVGKSENGDKDMKKKNYKKPLFIFLILLLLVYIAGCVVFSKRFFVNTQINGINASLKTSSEVDKIATDRMKGYKLTIKGRNNVVDVIRGDEVGLQIASDVGAKKLKEEQGFLAWPLAFFNQDDINGKLNISLNESKFDEVAKKLNIFKQENIKNPVSAYPVYVESKNNYDINKGDLGSRPIPSKVYEFVEDKLLSQTIDTEYPNTVYLPQKNTADNPKIKTAIDKMNKYNKMKIEYVFGKEKYILDGKQIGNMFRVDSENDYGVSFDREKVRNFVRSLSKKYSTYGDPREIISASTGGKLKVTGGSYGWLIDREKETDALVNILQEGKDVSNREPIYAQKAVSRENGDLGNDFIEIDLTKQHMWFVRDGKAIVSTPIVSGNPNRGDATPPGIYGITYKQKHAVLRGPGYASPVVYWMPFNGSIGIHDASWQPVYGGNRYLYAGSHGCINTPLSKVAEIFKLSKEGTPVVVHY